MVLFSPAQTPTWFNNQVQLQRDGANVERLPEGQGCDKSLPKRYFTARWEEDSIRGGVLDSWLVYDGKSESKIDFGVLYRISSPQ